MICIDSDVFLIYLRYPGDHRARATRRFLANAARAGNGATTVFNVLEVTGVSSFNLSEQQVVDFYTHFPRRFNVQVLPSHDPARLPAPSLRRLVRLMQRKMAFGDALIAALVTQMSEAIDAFVTWNDNHFRGRLAVPVFTPASYPQE